MLNSHDHNSSDKSTLFFKDRLVSYGLFTKHMLAGGCVALEANSVAILYHFYFNTIPLQYAYIFAMFFYIDFFCLGGKKKIHSFKVKLLSDEWTLSWKHILSAFYFKHENCITLLVQVACVANSAGLWLHVKFTAYTHAGLRPVLLITQLLEPGQILRILSIFFLHIDLGIFYSNV